MFLQLQVWSFMLLQDQATSFDVRGMWENMGWAAKLVVILLFFMSAWSIGVMIDRAIAYNGARKHIAPICAGCRGSVARG